MHTASRGVGASGPAVIADASRLILPGVGHFAHGMQRLRAAGLIDPLERFVRESRRPVLGICLGAQILGRGSDEAPGVAGLGWIGMECRRFVDVPGLPVPHMGWNTVDVVRRCPLFRDDDASRRFYFVHSFHMVCDSGESVLGRTGYGISFASVVGQDNVLGTQFHPEKSHRYGLALLSAFAALDADALVEDGRT